jgi:predicted regulator of Ras-like GTPase activity (Roadblock/LC7/MglB family)
MQSQDDRVFRELITQIEGLKAVQLVTREGVIIHSYVSNEYTKLNLTMSGNRFFSVCEQILVSHGFNDMKLGIIQAEDGYFFLTNFQDEETFLILLVKSDIPVNVITSQLNHILERQIPIWFKKEDS